MEATLFSQTWSWWMQPEAITGSEQNRNTSISIQTISHNTKCIFVRIWPRVLVALFFVWLFVAREIHANDDARGGQSHQRATI